MKLGKDNAINQRGFTLIELLIVVAIIAILSLIALPNFLEAQVRAKVSRAYSDIRSIAIALETYCVDQNAYPDRYLFGGPSALYPQLGSDEQNYGELHFLTTPLAYLSSIPTDVFSIGSEYGPWPYDYINIQTLCDIYHHPPGHPMQQLTYCISSMGPDKDRDGHVYYDPTNGTISDGDIKFFNSAFHGGAHIY